MKIIREDIKVTKFSDVKVGSVFIDEDAVFMKTSEFYEIEYNDYDHEEETHYSYNAIDLGNGTFARFVGHDMVRVCNDAHLVVN